MHQRTRALPRGAAGLIALASSAPALCAELLSELADPVHGSTEAFVDLVAARIEQAGGRLTFIIETRGPIPETLPDPEDSLTYLWLLDTDKNPATGQPHGALGSEFNVRAVVSGHYGGGFVDVCGSEPGGGIGSVVQSESRIEITVFLPQIANPADFLWRSSSFHVAGGAWVSGNPETTIASADPRPYEPPARVRVTTPILMLSPGGPATGQLGLEAWSADGRLLPNDDYVWEFRSTNSACATVGAGGLVTAVAPPVEHWQTPYVDVIADGVWADNAALVRITATDLGVEHHEFAGEHVRYVIVPQIEGVDLAGLLAAYDLVAATDRAYEAQEQAIGAVPARGGTLYLVLDVTDDPATCVCGASGNPIRLGWLYGQPQHNSCFIVNDPAHRTPQWFVIFHEMGHDFTAACNSFNLFCMGPGWQQNFAFSEGSASLAALCAWKAALRCPAQLAPLALDDLDAHMRGYAAAFREGLRSYRENGAVYAEIDPNAVDGILLELYDRYGPRVWHGLFSTFLPSPEPLPVALDTVEKQATWFVAAMSASVGQDLRGDFAEQYGFPTDDAAWPEILAAVAARQAARPWNPGPAGDSDCDGDVDGADFLRLVAALGGPQVVPSAQHAWADADFDDDVDVCDVAAAQTCHGGTAAPPHCAP